MKLNFKRINKTSFLSEIGRQKRSINVNVDDCTYDPKGRSLEKWDSNEWDSNEWSLSCSLNDEYGIEFAFKKSEDGIRTLTPLNFILWGGNEKDSIIDEGPFSVETF